MLSKLKHKSAFESKLNPISINILDELNFGSLDGENDANLKSSFVITQAIRELLRNHYNYVLSPKGAGKSAVFKALIEKYPIQTDIIDFGLYQFISVNSAFDTTDHQYLNTTKYKANLGSKIYTISWSFYLAIKLIEDILANHSSRPGFGEFEKSIKKYDDFKEKYELYSMIDYVERFNIALKFTAAGIDYIVKPTISKKENLKPLRLNEVYKIINDFYRQNNIIARPLIDRVDNFVEREAYEVQKNYLQGLINSIEEITILSNIKPILFLRTDLFFSHSINFEYDKVKDRMIELKWTEAEILVFILFRFIANESIKKAHIEYFNHCISQNIEDKKEKTKKINRSISNIMFNLKKIMGKYRKYDITKTIDYDISYQFIKLYFPSKITHLNANYKPELIGLNDWFFTHFIDGNQFVNPRSILSFLKILVKTQYKFYIDHNLFPNRQISPKWVDDVITYDLFSDDVIGEVYKELQNDELRKIYKQLYSSVAKDIFIKINKLSVERNKISKGDINLKSYNIEKDEFERLFKFLTLLGYLAPLDYNTYYVKPMYRKLIDLF